MSDLYANIQLSPLTFAVPRRTIQIRMGHEHVIDVRTSPELARLAGLVRDARGRVLLQDGQETVAVVLPAGAARRRARTTLLEGYGAVPPRRRPEDLRALREAFEEGVAAEVVAGLSPQ
jgi:hypothetical protein